MQENQEKGKYKSELEKRESSHNSGINKSKKSDEKNIDQNNKIAKKVS